MHSTSRRSLNGTPRLGMDLRLVQDPELDRIHPQRVRPARPSPTRPPAGPAPRPARGRPRRAAGRAPSAGAASAGWARRTAARAAVAVCSAYSDSGLVCMVTSWPRATSRPSRPAPEPHPLARHRPHADEVEDLLPGHRDLDRLLQLAGGERRQDRLGVDAQLGAEPAADERRDDPDPLLVHPERAGDRGARLGDDLRADVDRQVLAAAAPPCRRAAPSAGTN